MSESKKLTRTLVGKVVSDKPQGAGGADTTAVKRVRKTDAPATAADGKGE